MICESPSNKDNASSGDATDGRDAVAGCGGALEEGSVVEDVALTGKSFKFGSAFCDAEGSVGLHSGVIGKALLNGDCGGDMVVQSAMSLAGNG